MTFWGFSADAALPGVFPAERARRAPADCAGGGHRRGGAERCSLRRRRSRPPSMVERATWWQWLLLALLLLLLLAGLACLLRPYLPHLEPRLEAEARDRALGFSVRQPVELQNVRLATLQQDNENLRIELARLTDALAHKGGDCAAGLVVPGAVIGSAGRPDNGKPIERGPRRRREGQGSRSRRQVGREGSRRQQARCPERSRQCPRPR